MDLFSSEIFAGTNTSNRVQVAKVGTFNHDIYGLFSITSTDLSEMKTGLEKNTRRQSIEGVPVLPFDYSHKEDEKGSGWIKSLEIDTDSNGVEALFAEVEWTPKAAQKIKDGEFKFTSPSIRRNYTDAETNETHKIILKGATLTNTPFLRDMEAVYLLSEVKQAAFIPLLDPSLHEAGDVYLLSEDKQSAFMHLKNYFDKGERNMELAEIIEALKTAKPEELLKLHEVLEGTIKNTDGKTLKEQSLTLSESLKTAETKLADIETDKAKGKTEADQNLTLSEQKVEDLSGKVLSLTKTLADMGKKSEFDQMLSEGKVCEAQRDPFVKGNMADFAMNAQPIKLSESGSSERGGEQDAQAKVLKLAETKQGQNKDLSFGDAVSEVLGENKELRDAYENG